MPIIKDYKDEPLENEDLIAELAHEFQDTPPVLELPAQAAAAPKILIERESRQRSNHIVVAWDKWAHLDAAERGRIIMDAFQRAFGIYEALNVTLAMGLTNEEARRIYPKLAEFQFQLQEFLIPVLRALNAVQGTQEPGLEEALSAAAIRDRTLLSRNDRAWLLDACLAAIKESRLEQLPQVIQAFDYDKQFLANLGALVRSWAPDTPQTQHVLDLTTQHLAA